MPASAIVKHLYDGSITLKDGTGTPVTLVAPFTTGETSISGLAATLREVQAYSARAGTPQVRHTGRTYPSGSFTLQFTNWTGASGSSVYAFVNKIAPYSANLTTLTNPGEVYAIDIVLNVEGTDLGDSADHTMTLTKCVCTADFAEGEPNTVTINFVCYGAISYT
jgi:hypothetical protein